MKNGKLEPNDSDTLQSIYNKLTVNGELKRAVDCGGAGTSVFGVEVD
jgi:hypothetical protein